jgi:predicted metalloprotease with PDZ domain
MADLKAALASVSGDAKFAEDFFARYIQGRDVVNYETLLARAGLVLGRALPGRAFAGDLRLQDVQGRPRVAGASPFGSPAYEAGLDRDDVILAVGGRNVTSAVDIERVVSAGAPGQEIPIVFERRGVRVNAMLRLIEDPRVEITPAETLRQSLTAEQRRFREEWLGTR